MFSSGPDRFAKHTMSFGFSKEVRFSSLCFQFSWFRKSRNTSMKMFQEEHVLIGHSSGIIDTNHLLRWCRPWIFCFSNSINLMYVFNIKIPNAQGVRKWNWRAIVLLRPILLDQEGNYSELCPGNTSLATASWWCKMWSLLKQKQSKLW